MRIGLFHGYELTGSGSNEYNRYLSRALAAAGHEVHVFCREPRPETIPHIARAFDWSAGGAELFVREADPGCTLHRLPEASVRPVYLTDKQRRGNVKAFTALTDAELDEYHAVTLAALRAAIGRFPVDLVHANHLVYQPSIAADLDVPFIVFPHGSSIEYTVRGDARLRERARTALRRATGIISGSREVLARILELYPDECTAFAAKSAIVGVGVDTDLFRPVARDERAAAVARLEGDAAGKRPAQSAELRARLDAGEFDAVSAYGDAYDHAVPDVELARELGGIGWGEDPVLLFVGALTAGKGVQGLLAAMPALLARHPDAHLVVVGSGAYREVLEAYVHAVATGNAELQAWLVARGFDLDRSDVTGPWADVPPRLDGCPPLASRVHFTGRLDHDRLRHLFPCADLAVFPSVIPEAYPLVLMESLSNGVLPVVSDFSGFADGLATLEELLGAELVDRMRLPVEPAGRVAGIAGRLAALLDDPAAYRLGDRLRDLAVEHFDWNVRAREMLDAYEGLVARSRKA